MGKFGVFIWAKVFTNGPSKIAEDSLKKIWSDMVWLGMLYGNFGV